MARGDPGSRSSPFSRPHAFDFHRLQLALVELRHPPPPPTPRAREGEGWQLPPVCFTAAVSDPAAPCTCCHPQGTRRRRPFLRLPSRQECNLSPLLRTPASSGTLEKLCPLRTQVGKLLPGLRRDKRDGSPSQPLPGAVARERPEPWPGAVPAACRGRPAGQRRGSRSPAAHAPPPRWPRREAESPLPPPHPRSPAAPTAGATPCAPGSPPAYLQPAGLVAASSHGRARHRFQEET